MNVMAEQEIRADAEIVINLMSFFVFFSYMVWLLCPSDILLGGTPPTSKLNRSRALMVDEGPEFKAPPCFSLHQILTKHLFCQGLCWERRRQFHIRKLSDFQLRAAGLSSCSLHHRAAWNRVCKPQSRVGAGKLGHRPVSDIYKLVY